MSDTQRTLTANFVADTSGFSPKINELIQRLKTLNQDFEQNKSKVNELNAKIKEYQQELNKLNSTTNNGASASESQKQRMQQLRDSIAACNTQIGTYRAAQTNLRSQINATNRELTEQQQAFNGVNTAAASFGDMIQAALRKVLDLLRQAAAYCYQVGSSFESSMSQVAAVSGASVSELERLTAKAKELGSSTKFTATQVAEAMNYMAMAGWKTEEMLSGIDGVLGLAAASGTDLATTSDIVTDALTAFGLGASDCAHFADVLAAASANANTNVSMMGETFKYCAPVAGALGFKAEEVAVGIGLMANAGVKATNAGTAMRKFMTELSEGLTITGKKIGEVTISTTNADGSMRSYAEILGELRDVFAQLTDSEKSAAAKDIVGQNALSGFLAMMNASESDVQKLTAAIADCEGAASSMAETMQDNVQGAVTKFNSALEGVGIAVYDKFKDGLTDAVNIFTECMADMESSIGSGTLGESMESIADSFRSAAREIALIAKDDLPGFVDGIAKGIDFVITFRKEIASTAAGFVAFKGAMSIGNVIMSAVKSYKSLKAALDSAKIAQTELNIAMDANPIGAVAAAVGLLVAGIVELQIHTNDAAEALERLKESGNDAAKAADKYHDSAENLKDIKKRYEDIEKAELNASERAEQLKTLQEELISQYPELRWQVDLLADSYDSITESIQRAIDAEEDLEKINAKNALSEKEHYQTESHGMAGTAAQDAMNELSVISGSPDMLMKYFGLTQEEVYAAIRPDANPTYEDNLKLFEKAFDTARKNHPEETEYIDLLSRAIGETKNAIADLKAAQKRYDVYSGVRIPDPVGSFRLVEDNPVNHPDDYYTDYAETEQKRGLKDLYSKDELLEMYKEEKQLADDMYSVGETSAEDYYKKLVELRDEYVDKGTHEWYVATAQIQNAYAKTADGIAEAAAKSAKKVKSSLDEVSMAYKKTLAAIDAEIERRNREKSDLAFQAKIDEIDSQLAYGRLDDFSKYELEKERQKLIDEHDDELYERSATDAKSIVKDVYEAKTTLDKADWGTREYTLAVGDYTETLENLTNVMRGVGVAMGVQNNANSSVSNIDESTKNNYVNVILQAVNKSNSQLIDELIKALHSGL